MENEGGNPAYSSLQPLLKVKTGFVDDGHYEAAISPSERAKDGANIASLISCTVIQTKTIIGAGLLTMPFAFSKAGGMFPGLALLLCVAIMSRYGFLLLAEVCQAHSRFEYKSVGESVFRRANAGRVIEICKGLYTTGTCIAYVTLLGDFVPRAVHDLSGNDKINWFVDDILGERTPATLFLTVTLLFPLSMLPTLNALRYTSTFGLIGILYAVVLVVVDFVFGMGAHLADSFVWYSSLEWKMLTALPLFSVALTGHYNAPKVLKELKPFAKSADEVMATKEDIVASKGSRFNIVITLSVLMVSSAYVVTGGSGYAAYGSEVDGDILMSCGNGKQGVLSYAATLARLILAAVLVLSYPLVFNSTRSTARAIVLDISNAVRKRSRRGEGQQLLSGEGRGGSSVSLESGLSHLESFCYSLFLVPLHVIIALLSKQVQVVLGYNGSIFGSSIVYIFPALFAMRHRGSISAGPLLLLIFGVIMSVGGVVATAIYGSAGGA